MTDEISPETHAWLMERAEQTRQRWRDCSEQIKKHSGPMRHELEALRAIDAQLPFAVLTVLLEHELNSPVPPAERAES